VIEIPRYAFNPQGFFFEGSVPDFVAPAGNPFLFLPNFSYRVRYLRKIRTDLVLWLCSKLHALCVLLNFGLCSCLDTDFITFRSRRSSNNACNLSH